MNKLQTLWGRAAALAAAGVLAGCGVGIGIEISDDDDPPSVRLSASPTTAQRGQAVRLSADASDDDYVWEVNFYRIDGDGRSTLLCNDRSPEWNCNTQVPGNAAAGSQINYFARAIDSAGHTTESAVVSVTVVEPPPVPPPAPS